MRKLSRLNSRNVNFAISQEYHDIKKKLNFAKKNQNAADTHCVFFTVIFNSAITTQNFNMYVCDKVQRLTVLQNLEFAISLFYTIGILMPKIALVLSLKGTKFGVANLRGNFFRRLFAIFW